MNGYNRWSFIGNIDKSLGFWSGGIPTPSFLLPLFKKVVSMRLGFDVIKKSNPTHYVSEISPVPIMYIQSEEDEIGDVSDVQSNEKTEETDYYPKCSPI